MKYAIQDTYWWFDTNDYVDHKETRWVQGIMTAKFKERNKTPCAVHTELLSEAKIYDTADEAAAVASLLSRLKFPSEIVVMISDKRLFEARLAGK